MADPIEHLTSLPVYPHGSRVAQQDERFWASEKADGAICIFIDCGGLNNRLGLGEVLPNIFLHTDSAIKGRLLFSLEKNSLADKFLTVFVSIAYDSTSVPDERLIAHIKSQLLDWAAFLNPQRAGISERKIRGLWGELYVLQKYFCGRFSPREVVDSYAGIHDEPQDLVGNNFSIEVKTTMSRAPATVTISSLDQLDANSPNQLLTLLTLAATDDGSSINSLASSINTFLEADIRQSLRFKKMIADALDGASEEQLEESYKCVEEITWNTNNNFPALRRSELNEAIHSAEYKLSLTRLSEHIIAGNIGDWIDGL